MTAVVDASVFVSALYPQDAFHQPSREWLGRQLSDGVLLVAPIIALPEVGGAIARRTANPDLGRQAVLRLQRLPYFRLVPVDDRLGLQAVELAVDLRLRGADAVYVAAALQLQIPLVTWDGEHRERAGGRIAVQTPY
ncbi:MAG: type II toxin-antitoxin system VapC family toxin [Chloroflexota bacterium]|nr:MAG: type II toxin-antitoxin system VapC family toxin [Chloroflexota bacterium]